MSLARIAFTFLVCCAFKKCLTPPNPPAAKSERLKTNFMESEWHTQWSTYYGTRLQWIAGIVEIATILAWNFPSSDLSQAILSVLVMKGGRPERLQLTPTIALGGIMIITGSLLRFATYRYLGEFFRFEASIQRNHKLITGGPYSIVRHPGYTGLLIAHSGWFLWQFSEGSWVRESGLWDMAEGKFIVLAFTVLVILGGLYLVLNRMSNEDEALRKHFGKQWDDWAKEVPYYVVPSIY
ncbi:hypothetical protein M413DRAFT_150457 [Hebeloma cylindrosporum]|uniref:Protein-S-isoprenylcysteine O-methyltransferase n=1 Tax=Hebeloma cylindrosporum TaxID=76867 RepID=A0A0C3CD29_HEBCY|nr:hypothetical protein M413DRAFT_150457 [Hebeloma cylindrosporum h7]